MALKVLYQGKEKSRNANEEKYKVTYYGKQSEIDAFIATLTIGTSYDNGYLSSYTKSNYGADLYQIQCEYTTSFQWGSYSNVGPTVVGKKSATLSVRNIQLPLEWLKDHGSCNYLTNWNYYLIGRAADENTVISTPSWWDQAQDIIIPVADRANYRWVKTLSEIPIEPDAQGMYWFVVQQPTMPGVQYIDYALFVVTQSERFRTASAAGAAVSNTINTITSPTNDFGLSTGGYDWKHDESSISYDGRSWIVTSVYTRSGSNEGWSTDLYS